MKEFTTTITPRLYETDALGHINNATIAAWFEVARMRFLESLADPGQGNFLDWILASLQIDFVSETFYGKDVVASIVDARVGNTSLTVSCQMSQDGKRTVQGKAVLVYMDTENKSPRRIPDLLREKIADL